MSRSRLEAIPAGTEALREVRYMPDDAFADCTDEELTNAVRWMRAAAHSAREGARHIEALLEQRRDQPCQEDTTPSINRGDATRRTTPRSARITATAHVPASTAAGRPV